MFDIGWPELLVIAIVLIVVVGPKDLPKMLRAFGRSTTKLRTMAGDFRKQFDDALKEAELDDVKSILDSARSMNPAGEIKKHLNPLNKVGDEIKASLNTATKPAVTSPAKGGEPATTVVHAAEPLKTGAAAMPGESAKPARKAAPRKPTAKTADTVGKPAANKTATARKTATKKPAAKTGTQS